MSLVGNKIEKVGAIIVKNKMILVVRKKTKDNRAEFIIPGGKKEAEETHAETLKRELKEELDINLETLDYFGSFDDIAIFENIPIHMDIYFITYKGIPKPKSEIKECEWIGRNYKNKNIVLGSVLERYVIPALIDRDIL